MSDSGETFSFPNDAGSREILLSMFSDALGYEVTEETELTPTEELTSGVAVQGRLDAVSIEMAKVTKGEQANLDVLSDTKAQAALLCMGMEGPSTE